MLLGERLRQLIWNNFSYTFLASLVFEFAGFTYSFLTGFGGLKKVLASRISQSFCGGIGLVLPFSLAGSVLVSFLCFLRWFSNCTVHLMEEYTYGFIYHLYKTNFDIY